MTTQLEKMLNLPESKQGGESAEIINKKKLNEYDKNANVQRRTHVRNPGDLDKVNAALPAVTGLGEAADKELDALAERAISAYDDLIDLGMNVEARFSARIFEVASAMLKNAIDAKAAKIDKKLKMEEEVLRFLILRKE